MNGSSPKPGQLTAMISSTALDLPEHRAAVKEACLSAGVFPIGMEHLPARDASGITVSLEMVDQADIYLGIYAWRYGWVPEGKDLSITEMEFDRAVERKNTGQLREILVFTAHDDHPFTKKDIESGDDAQKKLAAFKTKAAAGRVRQEFRSVEELRRLVSEALHQFLRREQETLRPSSFVIRHSTSIPHNLPSLQPFFGREDELRKIADALDPDSRTWGPLIDGPGGMGKTSLAVRAAYAVSPAVFKKIVFVSLKTRELDDDGVRDLSGFILSGLAELFGELARELGQDGLVKAAEEHRPRLLLDALRGTQTLLLLDNLESLTKPERDTVFTFVKKLPPGCKAILTARGRIGSAAEELILEKLSEAAALATLGEIATRNPLLAQTSEAERIVLYRETGGKPLLLRWTAGQLGRGHCLTFTDAIAQLRSCPAGNDPLEFIFGDLVEDFSEAETRVLCALSYFTLPAKVEHIAAIAEADSPSDATTGSGAGLDLGARAPSHAVDGAPAVHIEPRGSPESEAQRDPVSGAGAPRTAREGARAPQMHVETALKSLVNRSLVVPSEELQTFALVPMVADFLRKAKPEVVAETGARLEKRAYALIVENGYQKHDHFSVLDAAWPAVAPALPRFLAGPNDRLQIVCNALEDFLNFTGRWDEKLTISQQAEDKAIAMNDSRNAGLRARDAGYVHFLRREASAVLACADRAETHWQASKAGPRERAIAIHLRGLAHYLKHDYSAAITAYRDALELDRSLSPESVDVATGLNALANAEQRSGEFASAERDYREALRIAHVIGDAEGVAACIANLAGLALDREDWLGAETLAREGLPLSEKAGRNEIVGRACQRLAKALVRQGKLAEALPHARRAVEIYTKLASPDLAAAQATLAECEKALPKR